MPRPRRRRLGWGLLILALAACSCDEGARDESTSDESTSDESTVSPSGEGQRPTSPGTGPSDEQPAPSPWPTDVRSFRASVEAFENVEGCVEGMRGSVPVEVGELLSDLGYENALGEICRGLEAAKLGEPERCDEAISSAVARSCRVRVATLHGQPEACPPALGVDEGRDPLCLAWASRDAGLCDGAPLHSRGRCRAVATGDPAPCRDRLVERSPAACRALVARLGDLVGADAPDERPEAELVLLRQGDSREATLALPPNAARDLERGVVLGVQGCRHRALIRQPQPMRRDAETVVLALELLWGGDAAPSLGPGSEIELGPVGTGYALRGELALDEGAAVPGAPLSGTFEGTFTRDGTEHPVSGRFRTFVRDLAPLPERCAPMPSEE